MTSSGGLNEGLLRLVLNPSMLLEREEEIPAEILFTDTQLPYSCAGLVRFR